MKLIKRSELAANAHYNWLRQYYDGAKNEWKHGKDKESIYNKLIALGSNPNADDVDKTIGKCDECGAITEECVQIGEEPDYGSATACICIECVKKSLKLFREGQ